MIRAIAAVVLALLTASPGAALAQSATSPPASAKPPAKAKPEAAPKPELEAKPDSAEEAARTCVHNRLKELVAEAQRGDIATDAALNACTSNLKADLKTKKKTYCEAVAYVGWLVADENNKLNGVQGQPYRPDKAFLQNCAKTESWEKHR
jgi:hypothetical protein